MATLISNRGLPMRLLCPFCQQSLTVPDDSAGKPINCMYCGQQFAAPQLYSTPAPLAESVPVTVPASAIPRNLPPQMPEKPPVQLPDSVESAPTVGYARTKSLTLNPAVVRWVAPAALFVIFVLTFFSWNGMYPAGYSAYSQSAWGGLFAGFSQDEVAEDELKLAKTFDEKLHTSWWLLPYLPFLILALIVAWAGPILAVSKVKLPGGIEKLWQYRPLLLGGLCVMTLMFLMAQWASGFGLQRAVRDKVESEYAEKKAAANTPEKMQRVEMTAALMQGAAMVRTTPWLRLAVLLHLVAALAVLAEAGLMLRGNKPPPRVGVMW